MRIRLRWILASVAVALVAALLINALVVSAETKRARADIGQLVTLPGGDQLQVRQDGPLGAPTIVLLHGFAGSLHWWQNEVPLLAARYRVVRFDLLGHGGSSKPSGGYSMEHQAQLIDEALHQLGVRRALIVGHSMGGLVATALATRDRSLVAGVALVDSPPTTSSGKLPFTARVGFVPVLGQALRSAFITNGEVRSALQSAFAPHYPVSGQFITDFWHMTYTSYTQSHSADGGYLEHQPLAARLTALGLPVLAIYGTRDAIVSPAAMRADYATVPRAQVVAISGAGHSPMVEKPYATAGSLLPFAAATLALGHLHSAAQ
ncbi:MAG TPA: alpha/beta hydrolase [Solirubrobacteraceae bacterium]|nr:alpha/beta hydrolase [Solirubrobacteraceae bacterium]